MFFFDSKEKKTERKKLKKAFMEESGKGKNLDGIAEKLKARGYGMVEFAVLYGSWFHAAEELKLEPSRYREAKLPIFMH